MFKKEYLYDFVKKGYKSSEYNRAVTLLIKRLRASGNIEMANIVHNIQMNNSTIKKVSNQSFSYKTFSQSLNNYNDFIKNKAHLLIKGYQSSIINSVLLFGDPGTGKTFFVHQICKSTKLKLVEMNLSTILDFRFGESIKKLELFIENNKDKRQVIFFDEADSIFTKRGNLRDVFETSGIITTMLQLLDLPRKALIIFSTNLIAEIDKAIVRRFDLKINFNQNLNSDLKENILNDFLGGWNVALSKNEMQKTKKYTTATNLNLADLKLIAKRIAINKALDNNSDDNFEKMLTEVHHEIKISKVMRNG